MEALQLALRNRHPVARSTIFGPARLGRRRQPHHGGAGLLHSSLQFAGSPRAQVEAVPPGSVLGVVHHRWDVRHLLVPR